VQTDDNEMLWMSDGRLRTEKKWMTHCLFRFNVCFY
jgi:hypothetical protein